MRLLRNRQLRLLWLAGRNNIKITENAFLVVITRERKSFKVFVTLKIYFMFALFIRCLRLKQEFCKILHTILCFHDNFSNKRFYSVMIYTNCVISKHSTLNETVMCVTVIVSFGHFIFLLSVSHTRSKQSYHWSYNNKFAVFSLLLFRWQFPVWNERKLNVLPNIRKVFLILIPLRLPDL